MMFRKFLQSSLTPKRRWVLPRPPKKEKKKKINIHFWAYKALLNLLTATFSINWNLRVSENGSVEGIIGW